MTGNCLLCNCNSPNLVPLGPVKRLFLLHSLLDLSYNSIAKTSQEVMVCRICDNRVEEAFSLEEETRAAQDQLKRAKTGIRKMVKGAPGIRNFLQRLEDRNTSRSLGAGIKGTTSTEINSSETYDDTVRVVIKEEPKPQSWMQDSEPSSDEDGNAESTGSHPPNITSTVSSPALEEEGSNIDLSVVKNEPFAYEETEPFFPDNVESDTSSGTPSSRLAYYAKGANIPLVRNCESNYTSLPNFGRPTFLAKEGQEHSELQTLSTVSTSSNSLKKIRMEQMIKDMPCAASAKVRPYKCKVPGCSMRMRDRATWLVHMNLCKVRHEEASKILKQ